jgi:phage shock protein C
MYRNRSFRGREEIQVKKLYRSSKDSMLAGVCGGLGKYFNMDSTLIRLLFAILFFVGLGSLIFVYLIWIFVVPVESDVDNV